MGMAASQARFLCLTARKSNTEYQGQQVNQQRTILANESAGLYAQMMDLQVPTPPSSSDYYKTTYAFSPDSNGEESKYSFTTTPKLVAANTYQIGVSWDVDEISMQSGKTMNASVTSEEDDQTGETSYTKIKYGDTEYTLTPVTFDSDGYETTDRKATTDESGNVTYEALDEDSQRTTVNKSDLKETFFGKQEGKEDENYYYFGSSDASGVRYYISESKLKALSGSDGEESAIAQVTPYYANSVKGKAYGYVKGQLEKTESGRYDLLTITESNVSGLAVADGGQLSCQLNVTEVRDDEGYEEAMNDYKYAKAEYDKKMEDINSKTEIIQQKDKTLELRLKQLDTEQEALKNELEAVQEVINKNVESTFTTFKA